MIELLAPAGAFESLVSGVRAGCDAVYLGAKSFSARANATNFDDEELEKTVKFCHVRNVLVYVTVNIMLKEDEIKQAIELIEYLNRINVDGIIVQDLGLARLIHDYFPELPIHGSTQMSVHNPSSLEFLKEMGFKRIVVARELSKTQLREFCLKAKEYNIEVEYFVHGALCMSVSGQCLMSAMIGRRSGNRGQCAQTCRLPFGKDHDLSLKDSSLFDYIKELEEMGVVSLKIEGRMKRPEYVAMATKCCRDAIDKGHVEEKDKTLLQNVFSRSGFTQGYYLNQINKDMFGTRTKEDVDASSDSFNRIHELYRNERQSVEIKMSFIAEKNKPMKLICDDVIEVGEIPLIATNKPTTKEDVYDSLAKLGGTPFKVNDIDISIDDDLFIRKSVLNDMRRNVIEKLIKKREEFVERNKLEVEYSLETKEHHLNKTYIRLNDLDQLPSDLSKVDGLIIPIDLDVPKVDIEVIAECPRWITNEKYVLDRLNYFYEKGVRKAYINNIGSIALAKKAKMSIMGSNYLNVANSESAKTLKDLEDITCSAELAISELKQIQTNKNKGIVAYGHLPLMLFVNCPLHNTRTCLTCDHKGYLVDRMNVKFPIRCRNSISELLNHTPIYLADKKDDLENFDYIVLYFTIETKNEVENIIEAYTNNLEPTKDYTRGLYYRSVI